ncbi:hypothetical protein HDV02_000222, partial [Globomyces sp. JEL0801]
MLERFLNIEYYGTKTDVDITTAGRLSQVNTAIKAYFGEDIPATASRIQLYDQQGKLITDLDNIPEEYFIKGGSCVVIGIPTPPSSRQSTQTFN